ERSRVRLRGGRGAPGPCARDQPHPADRHGNLPEGGAAMTAQITAAPPLERPSPASGRPRMSRRTATVIQAAFLIVIALISLIPGLAIFVGTFQDGNQVIRNGMSFSVNPSELTLHNYVMLLTDSGLYFQWCW